MRKKSREQIEAENKLWEGLSNEEKEVFFRAWREEDRIKSRDNRIIAVGLIIIGIIIPMIGVMIEIVRKGL